MGSVYSGKFYMLSNRTAHCAVDEGRLKQMPYNLNRIPCLLKILPETLRHLEANEMRLQIPIRGDAKG